MTKRLEERDTAQQFPVKASSRKIALSSKRRNKYLMNGDVGIVDMMHEGDITSIVEKIWLKSFFLEPNDSMNYFIYLMTLNSVKMLTAALQKDIYHKAVSLPFGNNNFIFPLLHEPLQLFKICLFSI